MIEHEAEIYSKPRRTWFQTEKEKRKLAEVRTVLTPITVLLLPLRRHWPSSTVPCNSQLVTRNS